MLFGFDAPLPLDNALARVHDSRNPAAIDFVTARARVRSGVRDALERYNVEMARVADKRRSNLVFAEGDLVWLNTKNLRLPGDLTKKLAAKWAGPYVVLKRISDVAYQLQLPAELSGLHDTFHVSLLKPHHGQVPARPMPILIDGEPEYEVDRIVGKRLGRQNEPEYLVAWKGYSATENTW